MESGPEVAGDPRDRGEEPTHSDDIRRPAAGYPVSDDEPRAPEPPPADGNPLNALERLLRLHLFTDLYKASTKRGVFRERLCFYADFLLMLFVYVALLALVAVAAWKLFAPLPPLP